MKREARQQQQGEKGVKQGGREKGKRVEGGRGSDRHGKEVLEAYTR